MFVPPFGKICCHLADGHPSAHKMPVAFYVASIEESSVDSINSCAPALAKRGHLSVTERDYTIHTGKS
jgi:hypothetical protein